MAIVLVLTGRGRALASRLAFKIHTVNPFSFQLPSLLVLVGALSGCRDRRGSLPAPSGGPGSPNAASTTLAPAASFAAILGIDAGELVGIVPDPPSPPGDLAAEIAHFTTLDACVTERAPVDPLLGDALEGIGYDTFLRDACRILDAAKAADAARCDAIDASSLRVQCRTTVAETTGTPDGCPWATPSRPDRGRDARCVAIASRDPALCVAAAASAERATCEAVVRRDPTRCRTLGAGVERARCARDADRWRALLGAPSARSTPERTAVANTAPSGALHLEDKSGHDPLDVDLGPDLARGVTLVEGRDGLRVAVGEWTDGVDFIAPSPNVRASLALGLVVPATTPTGSTGRRPTPKGGGASIEHVELLVPGRAAIGTPYAHSTLVANVQELRAERGAPVRFTVDGELGAGGRTYRVHAEATTFVRDVVREAREAGADFDLAARARAGLDAGRR